jgi:hypothetical protein
MTSDYDIQLVYHIMSSFFISWIYIAIKWKKNIKLPHFKNSSKTQKQKTVEIGKFDTPKTQIYYPLFPSLVMALHFN